MKKINDPDIKKILDLPAKFSEYDVLYDDELRKKYAKRAQKYNVTITNKKLNDIPNMDQEVETCEGKLGDCIRYLYDYIESDDGYQAGQSLEINISKKDRDAFMKFLNWFSKDFTDFKNGALEGMGIKLNESIDFEEANAFGKYVFGKAFKSASETDDGWVFFNDKDGNSLGEEQTWDELEANIKQMKKNDPKFAKFFDKEMKKQMNESINLDFDKSNSKPLDPKYAEVAGRVLKELEDLTPVIEDDRKVSLDAHRYLLKAQLELERFISELEEIEYHDKMNA